MVPYSDAESKGHIIHDMHLGRLVKSYPGVLGWRVVQRSRTGDRSAEPVPAVVLPFLNAQVAPKLMRCSLWRPPRCSVVASRC